MSKLQEDLHNLLDLSSPTWLAPLEPGPLLPEPRKYRVIDELDIKQKRLFEQNGF